MMECIKTPVFDLAGTVDVFISRQVRYQHCGDENECAPSFAPLYIGRAGDREWGLMPDASLQRRISRVKLPPRLHAGLTYST